MITHILTDIEGTTSSISFVKEVLFPYAYEHLPAFVEAHCLLPEVSQCLDEVATQAALDRDDIATLIAQLRQWIDQDVKQTALKTLQGMIWKEGYEQGAYTAHVYRDAYQALTEWKTAGHDISVYSSGSVQAQKLFFQYSDFGDMRSLFSQYFDTGTGHKRETASYRIIQQRLVTAAENILFLSDIREELTAAQKAGFKVCWLTREADCSLNEEDEALLQDSAIRHVKNFSAIDLNDF
ncbi:MAG: acireductone synthase [Pseudomonadales bacterium]|nr:acireductone synthase [Pseudomonadales bacterium]